MTQVKIGGSRPEPPQPGGSARSTRASLQESRTHLIISYCLREGLAEYELDGLVTMSVSNKQVLLPIWHDISKDDVMRQSPSLADKVALRTTDFTIAENADEISAVVMSDAHTAGSVSGRA